MANASFTVTISVNGECCNIKVFFFSFLALFWRIPVPNWGPACYLVITESTSERSNWQPSICRFVVDAQTESCILGRLPDLLALVCSTFYDKLPFLTYIYSLRATN